jgi:hypothetical protein
VANLKAASSDKAFAALGCAQKVPIDDVSWCMYLLTATWCRPSMLASQNQCRPVQQVFPLEAVKVYTG